MPKEIKITIKLPSVEGTKKLYNFLFFHSKRFFLFVINDVKTKKIRGVVLLIMVALIFWKLGINAGLLWFLFLSFLFYGWENRIIAVCALISLASCPFLLSFKKDAWAETMAIYAYYFLVMTVVLQIVEYKRDSKNRNRNEKK